MDAISGKGTALLLHRVDVGDAQDHLAQIFIGDLADHEMLGCGVHVAEALLQDVVLVIQWRGKNWLIPSNANIKSNAELRLEGIEVDVFLKAMGRAGAPLNILILDACRNNPLPDRERGAARGLAIQSTVIKETAILYSAALGQAAKDGPRGGHGMFTGALLKVLDQPGLTLEKVFKVTATKVAAATGGDQTPWFNSSVTRDFYFKGGPPAPPVATRPTPDKETVFWQSIKDSKDPADYHDYLAQYPKGAFARLAKRKMKELSRKQVVVAPPLKARPIPAAKPAIGVYPSNKPGDTFRDCPDCPEMVVIPAGSFRMGDLSGGGDDDEKPVHEVRIGKSFAVGKYEVTRGEFARFVSSTGHDSGNACLTLEGGNWKKRSGRTWRKPGFRQTDREPVVCVNWRDAKAYLSWLSGKTGKTYRLLSESEWEYVARAKSGTNYPWGSAVESGNANCAGCGSRWDSRQTAPVGSFRANEFGVHDTAGNVWEWLEDCSHDNYDGAPIDGRAWITGGDCTDRVLRGGSWNFIPRNIRSAGRYGNGTATRSSDTGFRIVRTLSPTKPARTTPKKQLAALTPLSFTVESLDETRVVLKTANVRAQPTTTSAKNVRLQSGRKVQVTGMTRYEGHEWYRVSAVRIGSRTLSIKGWIHLRLLSKPLPKAKPTVDVYLSHLKPGDTFRDCTDCPEMVIIPAGTFRMGDLNGTGGSEEKPVHEVRIGYSIAVGKFEVTRGEWVAVMGSNKSLYKGDRRPVNQITWDEAKRYLRRLNAKTGKAYRLLTEAEWEYMARAGSASTYPWGNAIDRSKANYGSRDGTVVVGSYRANAFGVHDTVGNVWEWVEDCYDDSYSSAPRDGSAWTTEGNCSFRVSRGGSWNSSPRIVRSAVRSQNITTSRSDGVGFRVARTLSR